MPEAYRREVRAVYRNPIMVAGKYTKESAELILQQGLADLVAFGQPFITNPDFVERISKGHALTPVNYDAHATFYGGDGKGYIDYPTHADTAMV